MPLFQIQDADRPAFVVADSFDEAVKKWSAALVAADADGEEPEPPCAVLYIADDGELIIDDKFGGEKSKTKNADGRHATVRFRRPTSGSIIEEVVIPRSSCLTLDIHGDGRVWVGGQAEEILPPYHIQVEW